MPFCENCGEKINAGDLFCESCGTPVEKDSAILQGDATKDVLSQMNMSLLNSADWQKQWAHINSSLKNRETGIILTRENLLLESLSERTPDRLHAILSQYISRVSLKRQVDYFYLDISSSPWHSKEPAGIDGVLEILREIAKTAMPKYLFILGDQDVVERAQWENKAFGEDKDKLVWGDFSYTILNAVSPWNIGKQKEENMLRVGRLPNYDDESLEDFGIYFRNVEENESDLSANSTYALSADAWEIPSETVLKGCGSPELNLAPKCNLNDHGKNWERNNSLYYFNLHGGSRREDSQWFGQPRGEEKFPEAMTPELMRKKTGPYFLGVEACYGAKYGRYFTPENSILLTCLQSGCFAFLGSSMVATGAIGSGIFNADNMIGGYLQALYSGCCAGDAYLTGLERVWNQKVEDPSKFKTIAEFSLYGDPSAGMSLKKRKTEFSKAFSFSSSFRHISQPDIRAAVEMYRCEIDAKMQRMLDEFVQKTCFPSFSIEKIRSANTFSFQLNSALPLFCQHYSFPETPSQFHEIYCDPSGKIVKFICSK